MNKSSSKQVWRWIACVVIVAVVVIICRRIAPVNPTTVALIFLVAVLVVSAFWGLQYSVVVAVLATLAFNYYFLPPYGTLTISDPQNWIALVAFLATALIASELSEKARRQALAATQRRKEIERLYGFSQQLLTTENLPELLNLLPRFVVNGFGVDAAALFVTGRPDIYRSDPNTQQLDAEHLRSVAARGEPTIDVARQLCFTPLRLGVKSAGALGISGGIPSRETLEALGTLIAIAIERTGAVESLSRAEATRESEKLRSAILDSVTHEFRTPLTGIKASVTTMLADENLEPSQRHELLSIINEEADRLNHLVGEAAEMAQLDANQVELHREPHSIGEAITRAMEEAKQRLTNRPVELQVPETLPLLSIDLERITSVLVQLLENAAKYSPAGSPIRVTAEQKDDNVTVSVADHGHGIDDFEQALVFDKFYRGKNERYRVQGTGLGLAIAKAVVEAHAGSIGVTSQVGHGSVFHFTLLA